MFFKKNRDGDEKEEEVVGKERESEEREFWMENIKNEYRSNRLEVRKIWFFKVVFNKYINYE